MIIDVAVPNDRDIMKEEYEKLEEYRVWRGIWKVKARVVPVMVGVLGA